MPCPKVRCGLGVRWMSNRWGSGNTRSSRLAAVSQGSTTCPAGMRTPPTSVSIVVIRPRRGNGVRTRSTSSIAAGSSVGSARTSATASGSSWKVITLLPSVAVVVMCPAMSSSPTKPTISSSASRSPSTSAWTSLLVRSLPGFARRDLM